MEEKTGEEWLDSLPHPFVVVKACQGPLFYGQGDFNLACCCGEILIVGYSDRQFCDFSIECDRCGVETCTATWPRDEPMPQNLASFGEDILKNLRPVFSEPRFVPPNYLLCGLPGFFRNQKVFPNRAVIMGRVIPDKDGLLAMKIALAKLDKKGFASCIGKARARAKSPAHFSENPLGWAFTTFEDAILSSSFGGDTAHQIAYFLLEEARNAGHAHLGQPHCAESIHSLFGKEFFHGFSHLTLASLLQEWGNKLGFTNTRNEAFRNNRSPDLYINVGPYSSISMEVKAPHALQWPRPAPSQAETVEIIISKAKEAARQITGSNGGLLAIGSTICNAGWRDVLGAALREVAERGKLSRRYVAVSAVLFNMRPRGPSDATSGAATISELLLYENPKYRGPTKLRSE